MPNFDDMKLSIEALSGGKNTVVLDDIGYPSIMVVIPRGNIGDVMTGGSAKAHQAFIVNGVEEPDFLYSKFINMVANDRAYSLPFRDPAHSMNFDQAVAYCNAKGPGWHLGTNAEWSYIALWSRKNGTMPRGNNNYGCDHTNTWEKGVQTHMADATRIGRTATGSGPDSWSHDWTNVGIYDMNGLVWEWSGGLRLVGGEIQIIPDNNAAITGIDLSAASSLWKAIMPDGTLVAPGTSGTLKWDYTATPAAGSGSIQLNNTIAFAQADETPYGSKTFETIAAKSGVSVPEILKSLALFPADTNTHGGDIFQFRNLGERLPFRGGYWNSAAYAGVLALLLNALRSHVSTSIGFRSAFRRPAA